MHLSLMTLAVIVFLGFGLEPAQADDTNGISIQSIQVLPSALKVGDSFTITITLVNNSTIPIWLDGGKCSVQDAQASFFTVTFDNHAKIKAKVIFCAGVGWSQILNPGKSITQTSPDYTAAYIATEPGTASATVTFSYHVINQTDPTQPGFSQKISKQLLFTILNDNTGTKAITETVSSPLKQFQSGVLAKDVKCNQGLQLVLKTEDGTPACVGPDTAQKLMEKGWAKKGHIGISAFEHTPVGIYNLTSSTKPIILGMPFYIKAVVTNYQTEPITYYNGCLSPLSVSFDNIKTITDDIHCHAISRYTLGPNQSMPVQSDKIETVYNATGPNATTDAQIKFSYEIDGKQASMFTSMQIPIQPANQLADLANDTGTVTFGNQTYYFEAPNYTETAFVRPEQILLFHDVIFTLFPSSFGLPPLGDCEGTHYIADAKFSDGTSELLHIFVSSPSCGEDYTPIKLSTHTNPQAGLIFYDGKMKLLVSTSTANSIGSWK
ncbi:MAG: hypothetical protein ACREBA_01540 [Nitrosotalea sp.]